MSAPALPANFQVFLNSCLLAILPGRNWSRDDQNSFDWLDLGITMGLDLATIPCLGQGMLVVGCQWREAQNAKTKTKNHNSKPKAATAKHEVRNPKLETSTNHQRLITRNGPSEGRQRFGH